MPEVRSALVVDDDELVRSTVVSVLAAREIAAVEAVDGKEALELAQSVSFDLVISDLFMPGMDGLALIPELRKRCPAAKIILTTGGSSMFPIGGSRIENLEEAARLLGASLVIRKPFRPSELMAAVKSREAAP